MTIVESIKCVLQQNNDGLTSKQIYDEIIRQGLYSFGAENRQEQGKANRLKIWFYQCNI